MAKKTPLSKAQRQDNAPKVAKAEPNSREKAIHSKGTRYVLNLAAILCAVVVVELVLSFSLPASFFHDSQIPPGARLFLWSYNIVTLTGFIFTIGTALRFFFHLSHQSFPGRFIIRWSILFALVFLAGLILLFYVASWATFWQIGKFLDHHALSFWAGEPLQVFHWTDVDVVLTVLVATFAIGLLLVQGIPRWIERWPAWIAQRFLQACAAVVAVCFFWASIGELYGSRKEQRYLAAGIFYATGRDESLSPFAHVLADLRRQLWKPAVAQELMPSETIQAIRRPLVPMTQYLASVDRHKVKPWNVIILIVESLRADQLRVYGSRRDVMPAVDAVARESRVFLNTHSQASHTNYAVMAPLSSHYPLRSATQYIYPKNPSYPRVLIYDILKALGYQTGIFSSSNENWAGMINYLQTGSLDKVFHASSFNGPIDAMPGDTGFAEWVKATAHAGSVDDRVTIGEAIKWIDEVKNKPFFMYVNLQDSHLPYRVPADFPHRFGPKKLDFTIRFGYLPNDEIDAVKNTYADSLAYVDSQMARLFECLRQNALWDRSIVVLTGDHGQAFNEHGFAAHGGPIFDEVMRVPLIIRAPGLRPGLDEHPAQHVDVAPSVLDLLGLPAHPSFQGTDLFSPHVDRDRSIYMVVQTPSAYQYGIVRSNWKLIYDEWKENYLLYNLSVDPGEKIDLAAARPDILKDLARRLHAWRTLQTGYYADASRQLREYPPTLQD